MSLERWTEETMKSPDQLLKNPTPSALCIFGTKHSALFILRAPNPLFNHRLLTGDQDTLGALDDLWACLDPMGAKELFEEVWTELGSWSGCPRTWG